LGIAEHVFVAALYSRGTEEEEIIDEKIFVKRFRLKTRNLSRNFFIQIIKYLELINKLVKYYSDKNIGLINIHSYILLPLGVLLKWYFKAILVYDTHELETEISGLFGLRKVIAKIVEKIFIKKTDLIVVVSDSIADWYVERYKIQRPYVVKNTPNYKDKIEKNNKFRKYFNISSEKVIFLYQGGLTVDRGIELLLELFKSPSIQNIVIVFMGYGPLEKKVKEAAEKYDTIYYLPAVSPEVLLDYTASADYGIHIGFNTCLNSTFCLPNKLFEYLMAEIPVIISNVKEMAKIVLENKVGVVVESLTLQGVEDAINKLQAMKYFELQENMRKIKKKYCWEVQEKILVSAYQKLLGNSQVEGNIQCLDQLK
jgi:glycosyltransferase involved in cell wall biosynthesis